MKNKEFFYLQYNKIDWQNQEKTKINFSVNDFIIRNIIAKKNGNKVKIFDIGFGVGFFARILGEKLSKNFKYIVFEGCEPSSKNYENFKSRPFDLKNLKLKTFNKTFLQTKTNTKFDFITAIYVFTHFESDELNNVAKRIYSMLNDNGIFILVVANEKYLKKKLNSRKDLFIEKNNIEFEGEKYKEVLHYSEIPQIGTIIDYNREEKFYLDLFKKNGFDLDLKKDLDDNGFICTVFVFKKNPWMKLIHHKDYYIHIKDGKNIKIFIKNNVFTPDPKISYSTSQILNNLPDVKGKSILDIGCGTGIIGISCANKGAKKIVFADNNEKALINTRHNIKINNILNAEVIKSDLFRNINIDQKFDFIFANLPILDELWGEENIADNLSLTFLKKCKNYVAIGGKVFYSWASFGDLKKIENNLNRLGYNYKIIKNIKFGVEWYLIQISF